ncbi:hypothetical protein QTJ10_23770 [Xanthomonas hortorum pv. vitians]|nr:hypothetical protein [Xanthomonas hortorum]WJM76570.1 hypothetical protein QTJ10_23770 [Xanthomonas hortorum pv. vitians]
MAIASNGGGKQALETVQRLLPVLCQAPHPQVRPCRLLRGIHAA